MEFRIRETDTGLFEIIQSQPVVRGSFPDQDIWHSKDISSLRHFVKKMTGCDDPEWLSWPQASAVIEALKKMKERANG